MSAGKTLYLARHAKSSWHATTARDHDRPLNERGQRDAPMMAKRLVARSACPQGIVSSSATRAVATAELIGGILDLEPHAVSRDERLYAACAITFLAVLRELDPRHDVAMVVAHNPTVHEVITMLTGVQIDRVPSCAIATIQFPGASWDAIKTGGGDLVDFDYPKRRDS
jgi:phosphohistidine phosphatase